MTNNGGDDIRERNAQANPELGKEVTEVPFNLKARATELPNE
jgi:hypothetical protein